MGWSWVSFFAGVWLMSTLGFLAFAVTAAHNMKGLKDYGHDN
jgi:hypothetical protein